MPVSCNVGLAQLPTSSSPRCRYCLSIVTVHSAVQHFVTVSAPNGKVSLHGHKNQYDSMMELIDHYSRYDISVSASSFEVMCVLVLTVQGSVLNSDCRAKETSALNLSLRADRSVSDHVLSIIIYVKPFALLTQN